MTEQKIMMVIELLCEKIENLKWTVDFKEKKANELQTELAEAKKKINELQKALDQF